MLLNGELDVVHWGIWPKRFWGEKKTHHQDFRQIWREAGVFSPLCPEFPSRSMSPSSFHISHDPQLVTFGLSGKVDQLLNRKLGLFLLFTTTDSLKLLFFFLQKLLDPSNVSCLVVDIPLCSQL